MVKRFWCEKFCEVLWSAVCVDFCRLHVFTFSLCLTLSALALAFLVLISVLKLSFSVLLMPPLTFVICAAADENADVKWGTNGYHYQGIIINLLLTPNLGLITTKRERERARERSVSDKIPLQQMLNENEWANLKWTLLCVFLLEILSHSLTFSFFKSPNKEREKKNKKGRRKVGNINGSNSV